MDDGARTHVVRSATPDGARPFAAFLKEAWRDAGPEAPGFAGATDEAIAEITDETTYLAMVDDERLALELAWDDDDVVGFAAIRLLDEGAEAELAGIVVRSDHAGRGIGRDLVDACLDSPIASDISRIIVRTEQTNTAAQAFYARLGFGDPVPDTEDVDGMTVDVVEMTRNIR